MQLSPYFVVSKTIVTMDYRTDRVRIWVDDGNKVVKIPRVG